MSGGPAYGPFRGGLLRTWAGADGLLETEVWNPSGQHVRLQVPLRRDASYRALTSFSHAGDSYLAVATAESSLECYRLATGDRVAALDLSGRQDFRFRAAAPLCRHSLIGFVGGAPYEYRADFVTLETATVLDDPSCLKDGFRSRGTLGDWADWLAFGTWGPRSVLVYRDPDDFEDEADPDDPRWGFRGFSLWDRPANAVVETWAADSSARHDSELMVVGHDVVAQTLSGVELWGLRASPPTCSVLPARLSAFDVEHRQFVTVDDAGRGTVDRFA